MILNHADNIMHGDIEVSKIYCGDVIVWQRGGGRVLPEGYTAINGYYMEQSPFNTNFRPTSGVLKVEAGLTIVDSGAEMRLVGGFNSEPYDLRDSGTVAIGYYSNPNDCKFYSHTLKKDGGYVEDTCWSDSHTGSSYEISAVASSTKLSVTVNGDYTETITVNQAPVLERDVWIGCNGNPAYGGSMYYMTGTIHYLKLYDNDTLTRDFVPAVRDSDGQSGLYDFVTEEFYY